MVSNEMAFNLLCGEIIPNSTQTRPKKLKKKTERILAYH
jgi:hypothetical protein